MMRKPITLLGLLFLFVFVFSMAFTSSGRVMAGPDYCCAVEDPITHEVNRGYWTLPGYCNCIYNPLHPQCTYYCASSGG
jgi:hypothetical protein